MIVRELLSIVSNQLRRSDDNYVKTFVRPKLDLVLGEMAQFGVLPSLSTTVETSLTKSTRSYNASVLCGISSSAPYSYPLEVKRLYVPEWGYALGEIAKLRYDVFRSYWMSEGDTEIDYIRFWCLREDLRTIMVHPVPSATAATAVLFIDYVKQPSLLDDDDELIDIQPDTLPTLYWGLVRYGLRFRGEEYQDAQRAEATFRTGIALMHSNNAEREFRNVSNSPQFSGVKTWRVRNR